MLFKHIDFDDQDEQLILDEEPSNKGIIANLFYFPLFGFIFWTGYLLGRCNQ